ncbi:MAG: bifunctional precorrin-2 dehydrogenase/sirohydrochlorin ferrochelatase [Deltaproteobacteria bacterium]|nr:bifunctional precorrin-2 dehydrogenase/sirohydrochlorin ferrochelatase [Deltaproteobacteria bacterium]MBW1818293.1 bifunctional precorrin-2 dehydrogenase/sirohydrochlorin ferrochelatase [Deltaproteobacteria bacterium]MBW2284645.1 bifunctional precorrin-2 dehydrogenase/sirohydrochlorin ferrochelatase [Deltaproteobacteria bacterium]
MSFYPVFVDLEGKTALVVGGGEVAERKIGSLMECGASIRLVSRELNQKVKQLVKSEAVDYVEGEFDKSHLDGVFLAIAATDDTVLNSSISRMAREVGVLVNAVDQPADCDFIVPSVVKRGDLILAISTSGKSPATAKMIRKELEAQYGDEYRVFLQIMGRVRKVVLSLGYTQKENSMIFKEIVHSRILDAVERGDWKGVSACLRAILPPSPNVNALLKNLVRFANNWNDGMME